MGVGIDWNINHILQMEEIPDQETVNRSIGAGEKSPVDRLTDGIWKETEMTCLVLCRFSRR